MTRRLPKRRRWWIPEPPRLPDPPFLITIDEVVDPFPKDPLPVSVLSDATDEVQPPVLRMFDEATDPIPMDVLQRCEPRIAGGRVAWVGVDFAKDGSEQTIYRMPDGTLRVEPSRSNEP